MAEEPPSITHITSDGGQRMVEADEEVVCGGQVAGSFGRGCVYAGNHQSCSQQQSAAESAAQRLPGVQQSQGCR